MLDVNCTNADGLTPLLLVTRDLNLFEKSKTFINLKQLVLYSTRLIFIVIYFLIQCLTHVCPYTVNLEKLLRIKALIL